jgi:hypothetical protein
MQKILKQFVKLSRLTRAWIPTSHTKTILGLVFVVFVIAGVMVTFTPAKANFVSLNTIANAMIMAATWMFLGLSRLFLSLTIFFLELFINLAAYNNFIDAPPVVIGWLMVRDVANMFFVVVLLVIAFGTILGIEQYEFKKTLLKLILAAIFINFSKLFLQLIIDIAHVFTTTFLNAIVTTAGGNLINMFQMDKVLAMTPRDVNLSNIGEDIRIDLFIAGTIGLVFSIMMTVIMGAYLVIMLMRIVVLWVAIILSPIAFIAQVLPNTKAYADEFWKEFSHHVLVAPVMVFFLWLTFATLGNGDIANVVAPGLTGSEAQQLAGDLPTNNTISLSEASTWQNFASFLIAFGFLYVGLKQVEKLGVQGGGAISSATSFGKKVAGYATGYYLGRKLVDRGKDSGKEYLKLATNKTGINRLPFGSQSKGALRRKAALAKSEEHNQERYKELAARGGGISGALAPSKKAKYKQKVQTKAAEDEKLHTDTVGEAQFRTKRRDEQNKAFKANQKALLASKHPGKKMKDLNSEEIIELRNLALQPEGGQSFDVLRSEVLGEDARMAKLDDESGQKQHANQINLGIVLTQNKEFEANAKTEVNNLMNSEFEERRDAINGFGTNFDRDLNDDQKNEVRAMMTTEERVAFDNSTPSLRDARLAGIKTELSGASDYSGLSSETRKAMMTDVSPDKLAGARDKATKGLSYLESYIRQGKAGQKAGKMEALGELLGAKMNDVVRGKEGKDAKYLRRYEDKEYKDEMEQYNSYNLYELLDKAQENHNIIKTLGAKEEAGTLKNSEDIKKLKNTRQNQARVVSNAMSRGYGNMLGGALSSIDSSFREKDLNTGDGTTKVISGLLSGKSHDEMVDNTGAIDAGKISKIQESVRGGLKEKQELLFRALKSSSEEAEKNHGQGNFYKIFAEGVDAQGQKRVGLSQGMSTYVGKEVDPGGGAPKYTQLGSGMKSTGEQERARAVKEDLNPNLTINTSKDGRNYVVVQRDAGNNEKAMDYSSPKAKEAFMSLADKSAREIQGMETSVLNFMSGGGYDKSSWDGTNFTTSSTAMRDGMNEILAKFANNIKNAANDQSKQLKLDSLKAFLSQMNVEGAKIDALDIRDAEFAAGDVKGIIVT